MICNGEKTSAGGMARCNLWTNGVGDRKGVLMILYVVYTAFGDGERFDECALVRGSSLSLSAFDGLSGSPLRG